MHVKKTTCFDGGWDGRRPGGQEQVDWPAGSAAGRRLAPQPKRRRPVQPARLASPASEVAWRPGGLARPPCNQEARQPGRRGWATEKRSPTNSSTL